MLLSFIKSLVVLPVSLQHPMDEIVTEQMSQAKQMNERAVALLKESMNKNLDGVNHRTLMIAK